MQCNYCKKIFNSNRDLQRHLNRKIKCDRVLECDNCKKKFKTIQNLNKHLNNKKKCKKLDPEIENVILKLEKEVLVLEKEVLELKQINNINNGNITNNINNGTINNNTNNGTINNNTINIFGNESLDHITKQILEKEILKIAERKYDECYRKIMQFRGVKYPTTYIRMIDVHLLLTKLIYFTKKKNRTMKKENNKYYITNEDGWNEVDLDHIHIRTLTKHQEVLVQFESLILENKIFRKTIENYFGHDDDFKLKIEVGRIEFILSTDRFNLLNKTLDYELENIENLEINHTENIL
jgi:hypothetical protein